VSPRRVCKPDGGIDRKLEVNSWALYSDRVAGGGVPDHENVIVEAPSVDTMPYQTSTSLPVAP